MGRTNLPVPAVLLMPAVWRILSASAVSRTFRLARFRSNPLFESGIPAMKRRDVLAGLATLTGCVLASHAGFAQAKYPDRAIKLIVPFAPGGVNDAVARLW